MGHLTDQQREEVEAISETLIGLPRMVRYIAGTAVTVGALAGGTGLYGGKAWSESQVREVAREEAQNTLDKSSRVQSIEESANEAAETAKTNERKLNAVSRNQCQLMQYLTGKDPAAPKCEPAKVE